MTNTIHFNPFIQPAAHGRYTSGRGVLLVAIALLVVVRGASLRGSHVGQEAGRAVAVHATPSADSGDFPLFLPAIGGPPPPTALRNCDSQHPELCHARVS